MGFQNVDLKHCTNPAFQNAQQSQRKHAFTTKHQRHLSASSMTSHRTRFRLRQSVCFRWSSRRPGVATRMFIPFRILKTSGTVVHHKYNCYSTISHEWVHVSVDTCYIYTCVRLKCMCTWVQL